jgi:hypothetical protein
MTWRALAFDLYPPTKKKLHRLLHAAGTAMALLLVVAVWFTNHSAIDW